HGVPLCFFGEKKRTRTGSWPLLSYAPWVLQLLSEFAGFRARHRSRFPSHGQKTGVESASSNN
ncbi:hypothetical protein ACUNEX_26495, partial [Serratia sp. IR-2025]